MQQRKIGWLLVVLVGVFALDGTARAGPVTVYSLVSPTNGYTVTGTVTTTGRLGELSVSDILGWTLRVDAFNGRFFVADSSETNASVVVRGAIATETGIDLTYPTATATWGGQNAFSFRVMTDQTWALPWKSLSYLTGFSTAGQQGPTEVYQNFIQGSDKHAETNDRYISFQQASPFDTEPPASPFVVATYLSGEPWLPPPPPPPPPNPVPVPDSSLLLFSMGLAGLGAARRRSQSR